METIRKLAILADAAKYDASCASSGSGKRDSRASGGIGSTEGMGICHSYTPDGRCVSLLKILLTNFCIYDCAYCVNRVSSNVARARFSVDEVVTLTLDFYKRNYIEGLFLSSGIIRNADYTMEQMVEVARQLREEHRYAGYIHLKTIPEASPELLASAGRYADRLSINVELPTEAGLSAWHRRRRCIRSGRDGRTALAHRGSQGGTQAPAAVAPTASRGTPAPSRFAPAGQSTQMIVGADGANDQQILASADSLYGNYRMRRVYYSAFSPIPDASRQLPLQPPPLQREHRLYQADWLLRFYGYGVDEITDTTQDGMLDLDIDPKMAWAIRHPERFPVDLNRAPKEMLLRVPGLGVRNVKRVLMARRHGRLRVADIARLKAPMSKLLPFVLLADHHPRKALDDPAALRAAGPAAAPGIAVRCTARSLTRSAGRCGWIRRGRCRPGATARAKPCCAACPEQLDWLEGSDASLLDAPAVQQAPCWPMPACRTSARLPGTGGHLPVPSRSAAPGLLYRLLWRITHGERSVLTNPADADVLRATALAQAVRRDTHKMKAFVRFREVPGQPDAFIAWFEPQHHIVDRVAPFFARRFTGMRWAILTPSRSVAWDGQALAFGPGARREDAPAEDAREALWQTYYASIFNPARLNTRMMMQEMPASTGATCPRRSCCRAWCAMRPIACRKCMTGPRRHRSAGFPCVGTLRRRQPMPAAWRICAQASACRQCPLWEQATQTVFGQGRPMRG
jgi:putative DNA modification/repair radical SAM protein